MAGKFYDEEFKRRAVDLYESTPGATIQGIGADLGVSRETLRVWVKTFGTGAKTPSATGPDAGAAPESDTARIARLEAELAAQRAEVKKLVTERDILRSAAKDFSNDPSWPGVG
ncbi:transposase [Xylanimonas allomyrinae]|uniref:Transposase n=1 Tax=Xylanimonas allomyrinae TaxID=2509459 RepID=A0A4P6EKQ0_9MICO|nr:transposase [Xylanimonas allomyrinae]